MAAHGRDVIAGMPVRLKKTVVLVGMMGAGKTAVGKALAGVLHVPFIDSDHEIEVAANMTIAEIFSRDGGFVFNPIHNVLADVPPENIIAMYDAAYECGVYG